MSLTLSMQAAISGMKTSQKAIDTISNNLVNANTPGYTSKIHNQQEIVVNGVGQGVQAGLVGLEVDAGHRGHVGEGRAAAAEGLHQGPHEGGGRRAAVAAEADGDRPLHAATGGR